VPIRHISSSDTPQDVQRRQQRRTGSRYERPGERLARRRCSDLGDDLDPRLVHLLQPLRFHLGILVWDSADEVVTPAVLVDLARVSLGALVKAM
jgi:hypothetical protein